MSRLEPNENRCPDWTALREGLRSVDAPRSVDGQQFDGQRSDGQHLVEPSSGDQCAAAMPSAWRAALEHQKDCRSCREQAIAIEPTVVFQSLPSIELSADEVFAMRERVAGVLRGREVAGADAEFGSGHFRSRQGGSSVSRLGRKPSVSAGLAAAMVLLLAVGSWDRRGPEETAEPEPAQIAVLTAADEAMIDAALGARPLVEGVESFGLLDETVSERFVLMQGVLLQGASQPRGTERLASLLTGGSTAEGVGSVGLGRSNEVDFAWVADGHFNL